MWRNSTLRSLAVPTRRCMMPDTILKVCAQVGGPDGPVVEVTGRDAWALQMLIETGERGVTPVETPGPRWSGYVFKLRRLGIIIETVHEQHGGHSRVGTPATSCARW